MTPEVITALIAGAAGIFSGGGMTALLNYLLAKYKDRKLDESEGRKKAAEVEIERLKLEASENESHQQRPIDHYNLLVEHLTRRVDEMEKKHEHCTDLHIQCERKVGELNGRLNELTDIVEKWFEKILVAQSQPMNIHVHDPKRLSEDEHPG